MSGNRFVASNGAHIEVHEARIDIKCTGSSDEQHFLSVKETEAAREYFQHERDDDLGRWRWPENPDYVVYPDNTDANLITVLRESVSRIRRMRPESIESHDDFAEQFNACAEAYFEAHLDRKPWHDAKEGEIWVFALLHDSHECPWVRVHGPHPWASSEDIVNRISIDNPDIVTGRRIWPEDAS